MNRMKKGAAVGAILLATALSIGVGAPAFADNNPIIADGSFEAPITAGTYIPGDSIGAWFVNSGRPQVTSNGANSGSLGLGVDGGGPGFRVSQSFPTTAGATYQVRYYTHSNNFGNSQEDVFIGNVDFSSTLGTPAWDLHSFQFIASSATTVLSLQSSDIGAGAGYFDDVRVTLVNGAIDCQAIPTPVQCLPLVSPEVGIIAGSVAAVAGLSVAAVFLIRRRRTEVADGSVA